ncbi:putative eukaryotic translation initiation factor 3 subunit B [Helianthus annuus]|nr:putative eukaryotic translation initiation factor 3 subunit B [Helianthus annuus]
MQFSWRPRPPSLLCPEKEEETLKNLKKYSGKYEIEDQDISVLTGPVTTQTRFNPNQNNLFFIIDSF